MSLAMSGIHSPLEQGDSEATQGTAAPAVEPAGLLMSCVILGGYLALHPPACLSPTLDTFPGTVCLTG